MDVTAIACSGLSPREGPHMPAFRTEVVHSLGRDAAVGRLKDFVNQVQKNFKDQVSRMDSNWTDNMLNFSMTSYGFEFSGVLVVDEDSARLEGTLPFPALAFRGKIEKSFQQELQRALVS
jgi:hypothetical protein